MSLNFDDKVILGPMVRVGTLPIRLLSLDFGADYVYTEELIDYKLLKCRRIENEYLGTVDFVDDDHYVVFRTCEQERGKVILQLGTCDADRALKAAKLVERDVVGIDINMGCPKEFSIKGGMGAALLTQPEKVKQILTTLTQNLSKSVTCKIRVLPDLQETINLAKLIESTGVSAIAIHGRTKLERPQHKNRNDFIAAVADELKIPVIANGGSAEIQKYSDIRDFKLKTHCSSVMLSRAAENNCSIFRKEGIVPLDSIIPMYLKYAVKYDNHVANTKYCIQQMLGSLQETEKGRAFLSSQTLREICYIWGMNDFYDKNDAELKQRIATKIEHKADDVIENVHKNKKLKGAEVEPLTLKYLKNLFVESSLPKTRLINYANRNFLSQPKYKTHQIEKHFYSVVTIGEKSYKNNYLEKNKKSAEQGAALVACFYLNLVGEDIIRQCFVQEVPHERTLLTKKFLQIV
ncbi:tRNA-dihydrouridine(20) synthase-like [NAD(P)+] [Leptotrombidium deliense]|uniref:tRNA-dihydrouridine(20) synthase-like [NAD(P)+] n=1 Tax=Leptotrombidium deliense TaxID=299467 RepID=A0A443S4S7_9ACAR|nr:tRNA-dihydrouridine(20) synthase-like [NAD(P)+] [Leptotrombidium deliense]